MLHKDELIQKNTEMLENASHEVLEVSEEQLRRLPEASKQCRHCHREILRTWQHCPRCGKITNEHVVSRFTSTGAESASYILNGLISYHERMTMGRYPEGDCYLQALRYALMSVESSFEKESGDTV